MSDQADELRHLVRRGSSARRPRAAHAPVVIGVCGAKGGVGTTTTAVSLAMALVHDGRPTVVVDAAAGSCDVATFLNLSTPATVSDVLAGRRSVHEALQWGAGGLCILPGDSLQHSKSIVGAQLPRRLLAQLEQLGRYAEFAVLDLGRGNTAATVDFVRQLELTLLVTSPDDASVMETYTLLKSWCVQRDRLPLAIVVNSVDDAQQAHDVQTRLSRASRRFLGAIIPTAGYVPRDARIASVASAESVSNEHERLAEYVVAQTCREPKLPALHGVG